MKRRSIYANIAIAVIVIWTLAPLYWFLKQAFMTPGQIAAFPPALLPLEPQIGAFFNIFGADYTTPAGLELAASGQAGQIIRGLFNSLFVAVVVMILTILLATPLAYTFARLDFPHKNKLLFAILLSVALPPVSTLIPFYTMFVRLGLSGTRTGLILVTLTITIPFVSWMLIGYFRNLPPIERLARIDGFSRLSTFLLIVIPMSKGGIAVGAIIAFLFSWNEYVYAQILVNGTSATTLPAAVSGFLFQHPQPQHLAAALFVTLVPPAVVAFFLQRHVAEMNLVDPVR